MLTKDLLKYRVRAGAVKPVFVPADDSFALGRAREIVRLMSALKTGTVMGELETLFQEIGQDPISKGLSKLILDRSEFAEDDPGIEEDRWRLILAAQRWRQRDSALQCRSDMDAAVSSDSGVPADVARYRIYQDLPSNRAFVSWQSLGPEQLIDRYNCAQVQGLLLHASSMILTLQPGSSIELRQLLRQLKFHRLLAEIEPTGSAVTIRVDGPLSIFDKSAAYGMRLANFFPHVLNIPDFRLQAFLKVKNRELSLKISARDGLRSHYVHKPGYLPGEFSVFMENFNRRAGEWRVHESQEVLRIGDGLHLFPDMTISDQSGKPVCYIELFHQWHGTNLEALISRLEKFKVNNLIIGVSKRCSSARGAAGFIENSSWFVKFGFLFGDFPNSKSVLEILGRMNPRT